MRPSIRAGLLAILLVTACDMKISDAGYPRFRHATYATPVVRTVRVVPAPATRVVKRPVVVVPRPVYVPLVPYVARRPPYRYGDYWDRVLPYYGSTIRQTKNGIPIYYGLPR